MSTVCINNMGYLIWNFGALLCVLTVGESRGWVRQNKMNFFIKEIYIYYLTKYYQSFVNYWNVKAYKQNNGIKTHGHKNKHNII